jgi:hypothetical protein
VQPLTQMVMVAGLPLLQSEHRKHCKRAFAAAAKALEVVASPLTKLRAQLHLECAKCEADDDALIKVGLLMASSGASLIRLSVIGSCLQATCLVRPSTIGCCFDV